MINTALEQTNRAQPASGGITELVLTQGGDSQWAFLLPMIAHLSSANNSHPHSARWLTWITDEPIAAQRLTQFNIDVSRIRFIHCHDAEQQLWVSWDALAQGNSHTVIAAPGKLSKKALQQLERAAQLGQCQGVLLRQR